MCVCKTFLSGSFERFPLFFPSAGNINAPIRQHVLARHSWGSVWNVGVDEFPFDSSHLFPFGTIWAPARRLCVRLSCIGNHRNVKPCFFPSNLLLYTDRLLDFILACITVKQQVITYFVAGRSSRRKGASTIMVHNEHGVICMEQGSNYR